MTKMRDLLLERTRAGIARAKAYGKRLSRPLALDDEETKVVFLLHRGGKSISAMTHEFNTTRQTILRVEAVMKNTDAFS
ncbi:helix-turn-helix domain-containing protein [Aeromonas dhakensis]|uniref:helix-turn-helix domain-containing protein n=1 Tax=Aeromonas dhakensis TaxID=196024 RepID=UPI0038D1AAAC